MTKLSALVASFADNTIRGNLAYPAWYIISLVCAFIATLGVIVAIFIEAGLSIVGLGVRGLVAGFDIDTSHFTGNYPPAFAIFASDAEEVPAEDGDWTEIVPSTDLGPSAHHFVACRVP